MTYHDTDPQDLAWQPGAEPGIDTAAEDEHLPKNINDIRANCQINIIDFSTDPRLPPHITQTDNDNLQKALDQEPAKKYECRWVSVNGISWDVIKCLGNHYNLHRLAIEDVIFQRSRTKVDWYADQACIILTLQKLVMLHHCDDDDDDCHCMEPIVDSDSDEKSLAAHHQKMQKMWWWQRLQRRKEKKAKRKSHLPYSLDKDDNGRVDEFITAHSGPSADSPLRQIRTLHRYEGSKIPAHTEFMEKHSTLAPECRAVSVEQVSIFLLDKNTVVSFFEQSAEDVEKPILLRLSSAETMLRRSGDASLLLQAIIDTIVDLAAPVRDAYNRARKELQVDAMINPNITTSRALHIFGEEIDMLQNLVKPIVNLVNAIRDHNTSGQGRQGHGVLATMPPFGASPSMEPRSTNTTLEEEEDSMSAKSEKIGDQRQRAPIFNRTVSGYKRAPPLQRSTTEAASSVSITPLAHTYFGDVLDHCISLIQALEQMDASATNISTLIFNTVGARTNNFMMILAVVTVLFAPLTFISGYFGQNFDSGHGINHPFSFFWYVAIPVLVVFMLLVFATMLWDNIRDWFSKRGIRAHRHRRNKMRKREYY